MITKRWFGVLVGLAALLVAATIFAAQRVTVTGIVMEDYTLLDDNGETYDIADTEKGQALVDQSGSRVKVTGTVEEGESGKTIRVESFTVIPE